MKQVFPRFFSPSLFLELPPTFSSFDCWTTSEMINIANRKKPGTDASNNPKNSLSPITNPESLAVTHKICWWNNNHLVLFLGNFKASRWGCWNRSWEWSFSSCSQWSVSLYFGNRFSQSILCMISTDKRRCDNVFDYSQSSALSSYHLNNKGSHPSICSQYLWLS